FSFPKHSGEERNEEEQEFTRIHITEKSHAERNCFCQIFNDIQQEIERPEKNEVTERSSEKLFSETGRSLNFDTVVNHQQQYADGNTHRTVKVSGRQRTHVMNAEPAANGRNQVNRNKVDSVHQGDPNENGQSQRSDKRAVSVNNGFSLFR